MLSFNCVFVVVALLAVSLKNVDGALSDEEKRKIISAALPFVAECGKEFGVSEEEIKTAKEAGELGNINPCLMACFLKKIKIIDDKGLYSTEVAKELIEKYITNEEDRTKLLEITDTCKSVNDESVTDGEKGCERAKLIHDCAAPFKTQFFGFRR